MITKDSPTLYILTTLPLWGIAYLTDVIAAADVAACFGVFLMLFWLWKIIGNQLEMIRFLRMGAVILCAIQNLAWLTSSFTFKYGLNSSMREIILLDGIELPYYYLAIIYTTLFAAFLAYIGSAKVIYNLEKRICSLFSRFGNSGINKLQLYLILFTGIGAILVFYGFIGLRTINTEGYAEGEIPLWITLFQSVLPAQIILSSLFFVRINSEKPNFLITVFRWILLITSVGILLIIFFSEGRRPFIFLLIGLLFWALYYLNKRPKLYKILLVAIILFPLVSQLLVFSISIRNYELDEPQSDSNVVEKLFTGWEIFKSPNELEEAQQKTTVNLSTRPLVATPLAKSIQLRADKKTFFLGTNIINSAIWAIPGPLFPNKKAYPVQETLLYKNFPIGSKDTADSLYLYSYSDFGWLGVFIYPFLIFSLWYIVLALCAYLLSSDIILVIAIALLFQLIVLQIGESSVITWFVAIRSILFWIIVSSFLRLLVPENYFNEYSVLR